MDIYELRDMLKNKEITELPLRCATYSRVSTEKETQAASLVNMTDDFRAYVERQENWVFVKAYIDDGKSGLTTKKREDFLNMLAAGAAGEYDLLITGEISRFGRNILEGLQNIEYLLKRGIPVIFLYDDLNTYDVDSEGQIQQKFVEAEGESRRISKRVTRGHQKSIQKGHVLGNCMWGYMKKNCKLIIDEETAPMVREAFELYATDAYSLKEIEDILYTKGYRNTKGKKISHTTLSNIIRNPKYKGWFAGGKVKVANMKTKKQNFIPPEEWVTYKDESGEIVPALVSEELWEKANQVLLRRSQDVKGRKNCANHRNTYTGKLICTVDNAPYYCKGKNTNGDGDKRWACSHKIKNGTDSCPSVAIYESELDRVMVDIFSQFASDADQILDAYMKQYEALLTDQVYDKKERERLSQKQEDVRKRQDNLLDLRLDGAITLEQFRRRNEEYEKELKELQTALLAMESKEEQAGHLSKQISALKEKLKEGYSELDSGIIDRRFMDNYIRQIDVTPLENGNIGLHIHILSSEAVYRELEKIKGRTGHTFKKMIEAYENGMK